MRIGLYEEVSQTSEQRAAGWLEGLAAAEAQGYDAIWLAEVSAPGEGAARNLCFELGQLAATTVRVELGMHSAMPGLLHPLRVAEDLAVLDIMSSGRLAWAVRGPAEGADTLLLEQLEVIRGAWTGEPFAFEGEHLRFPELSCHPRPVRDPHPPLWLDAGWDGASALLQAGLGLFLDADASVDEEHVSRQREDPASLVAVQRVGDADDLERVCRFVERVAPELLLLQLEAAGEGGARVEADQAAIIDRLRSLLDR